jgi:hypothetical protein
MEAKIGIFDRNKKEVIWSRSLGIDKEGIAQILEMKMDGDKWYVLDRYNTLHVFEKEH